VTTISASFSMSLDGFIAGPDDSVDHIFDWYDAGDTEVHWPGNFTTCDTVDSLTAYAGLAPMPRQSGSSVWHRPSIGHSGNGRLRTAYYMASLTAARFNPVIHTFYNRLREAGKPEKVARCAAARKLLHIAWAVVKKDQPFDPNYAQG
jgi:transposase